MSQFVIYAGKAFSNDFEIVSSDGLTPEVLDPSDTGTITIQTSGPNPECILDAIPMTLIDTDNGLFEMSLTAEQTALLSQYVGFKEDGFKPIGNYEGLLDFTLVSGNKQAMITISVKSIATCQTA